MLHACTHVHTHTHVYTHSTHTHTHPHTHPHTHTHTHTHTHAHTHNRFTPATDDYGLALKHTEAVDRLKPSAPKKKSGKR